MDIPQIPFEDWEAEHRDELVAHFRDYLADALDDNSGFDLSHVEDYWTWAREEYACLRAASVED